MKDGKKTYILGMAKSPLKVQNGDFDGIADAFAKPINPGSAKSLELDFLRLVYAKKELLKEGFNVHAFLVVTTKQVVENVNVWAQKYNVEGMVNVIPAELSLDEIQILVNEKTKNRIANMPAAENAAINARADNGKQILEAELKRVIETRLEINGGNRISAADEMPFKIRWDYCFLC